jgi:CHAD domain-containing protein
MESEAKFALPEASTLEAIAALDKIGEFALAGGRSIRTQDRYLDTPDRDLLGAGYFCRSRESEGACLITVKRLERATGGIHRREELEITLPRTVPVEEWPAGAVRDLILSLSRGVDLSPILDLAQLRLTRKIELGDREVAELSLDHVECLSGEGDSSWREIEIELKAGGTEADLADLVRSFREGWKLEVERRSKFVHALNIGAGLLAPAERLACARFAARSSSMGKRARVLLAFDEGASTAQAGGDAGFSPRRARYWLAAFREARMGIFPPPEKEAPGEAHAKRSASTDLALAPDITMAEAARRIVLTQFRLMVDQEVGVIAGKSAESIHDMRVAVRRMRAALSLFGDWLGAEDMKSFRKPLQRIGKDLGPVRDLDVFLSSAKAFRDTLPLEERGGLGPFFDAIRDEYKARRSDLLMYLDSKDYARFKESLGEFLDRPEADARVASGKHCPSGNRLRYVAPVILFSAYADVHAFDDIFKESDATLLRYHQLRITTKRLRYALEFFREPLGSRSLPLIERVQRLQNHLGNLQDAVIACDLLRGFLERGSLGKKRESSSGFGSIVEPQVAAFLAARQLELKELLVEFPAVWAEFTSPWFGNRLSLLVATLL